MVGTFLATLEGDGPGAENGVAEMADVEVEVDAGRGVVEMLVAVNSDGFLGGTLFPSGFGFGVVVAVGREGVPTFADPVPRGRRPSAPMTVLGVPVDDEVVALAGVAPVTLLDAGLAAGLGAREG